MVALLIPSEYGYVLGTATVSALYLFSLGIKVGVARRAANVPYPYVYAEKSEAEKDHKKHVFNCTQRVHQNTIEIFPLFQTLLLVGGLKYPEFASGCAGVFLAGRMLYSSGYTTGDPAKRSRGFVGYLGLLGLLGASASTVYSLIKN
ncbi:hypothetical protein BD560DRAFT_373852 [Blakeslea trispora]|nr:hypothetical protein BD560DRAFT_373852 [Blakeslea trispora]